MNFSFQEIAFDVVCKIPAILFKPQFVNPFIDRYFAGFRECSLIIMVADDLVLSETRGQVALMGALTFCCLSFIIFFLKLIVTCTLCVICLRDDNYSSIQNMITRIYGLNVPPPPPPLDAQAPCINWDWFSAKLASCQYQNSPHGAILRLSYLHDGISYTD